MSERTLVLLRHSKAERPGGVSDVDRPLTARGHADAAAAGGWLARHGYRPDLVICSPSRRTRQTWHSVSVALADPSAATVHYADPAYAGSPSELLSLVQKADKSVKTVLMIGHNPGISMLSAALDPEAGGDSDGLRTSGLAVHRVSGAWSDVRPGSAALTDTYTARG